MPPRDVESVLDILQAARRVASFVQDMSYDEFTGDVRTQFAVLRGIEIIGEAAKRISEPYKLTHSNIPWRAMSGMRDVLIHAYDHVDINEVWNVVQADIPTLIANIEPLVPEE